MDSDINIQHLGKIGRVKFDIGCKIIDSYIGQVRYCVIEEFKTLLYNAITNCHTSSYSLIIRQAYSLIGNDKEKDIVSEVVQKLLNLKV